MGVVYEGFDPTLGRRVAIKTILRSVAIDAETAAAYSARFVREAQAVARLSHPHIVQVHDFGEQDEVAYLVMEFIEGRDLRSFFQAREKFPLAEVVRVMTELLDALDFAHEHGVIHRDVKPANLLLDPRRRVKLADFGVARIQESERSTAGTMVGTPAFMSPEQIKGGKIDGRTDIFSAGTILYELLTGEHPFAGGGAWTVAKKIVEEDPAPPSRVVASVLPAFDAVVKKALAKEPAQRFRKAREFAAALGSALAGAAPSVSAPQSEERGIPKGREAEVEFWRSIQNSNDPDEFEVYLREFPAGTYAELARIKIAKLREPIERARKEAEERVRLDAEGREKETALDKARGEAEEKTRPGREARKQEEVKARETADTSTAAADEGETVAIGKVPAPVRRSVAVPAMVATAVLGVGAAAYLLLKRTPVPPPPPPISVAVKPAPAAPEAPGLDMEKIKRETEQRVRSEYAEKAAAERAAAEKAAAEKAAAEKQAAAKAAAEKAPAAEQALAEKQAAAKAAAEKAEQEKAAALRAVAEKAAAEKAAAERLAAERAAALERAAAEKAATEKAAAERAAAEKLAAEKAAAARAAAAKPGWPSAGDRWVYEARDADRPEKRHQVVVEVQAVSPSSIRDLFRPSDGPAVALTHQAGAQLIGVAPGIASFSPYLRAFQELRTGERWTGIDLKQMGLCSTDLRFSCTASARVAGKERVTVRAGTYESWKLVVELQILAGQPGSAQHLNGSGEFIYWYAEEAKRAVKYRSRVRYTSYGLLWTEPDIDMELMSYIPAGTVK
jgi:serine/threonine-protein kinase